MPIEDDIPDADLDALDLSWRQKEEEERQEQFEHLKDLYWLRKEVLKRDTAENEILKLAENVGLKTDFEQYLTSQKAEGGIRGD